MFWRNLLPPFSALKGESQVEKKVDRYREREDWDQALSESTGIMMGSTKVSLGHLHIYIYTYISNPQWHCSQHRCQMKVTVPVSRMELHSILT
jgi:hypothetical protein